MSKQPLTPDELIAVITLVVIAGAVILYGVQKIVFTLLRRPTGVSGSAPATPADYVKAAPVVIDKKAASAASRPEAEAEARREVQPGSEMGIVSLTEKSLQLRDAENYQRGLIDGYATLLKAGYITGPKGKMQQALAAVAGHRAPLLPGLSGRQLQALNLAISAVPSPAEEPAAPEITPIAGRELAPGVEFASND